MNERIRELAEEAGLNMWVNGNNEVEFSENEKRFAELIVKECAKFLDENSGYDESNNSWHPQPEDLLQHFGVQE